MIVDSVPSLRRLASEVWAPLTALFVWDCTVTIAYYVLPFKAPSLPLTLFGSALALCGDPAVLTTGEGDPRTVNAAYRERFGFHGVHAIMATFPLKRLKHASRVLVAGAEDPSVPRHLGFEPFGTVEDALAEAGGGTTVCVRYPAAINR